MGERDSKGTTSSVERSVDSRNIHHFTEEKKKVDNFVERHRNTIHLFHRSPYVDIILINIVGLFSSGVCDTLSR